MLTYLLTPWNRVLLEKLTGFAANQEIPRILWNPQVHCRIQRFLYINLKHKHKILLMLQIFIRKIFICLFSDGKYSNGPMDDGNTLLEQECFWHNTHLYTLLPRKSNILNETLLLLYQFYCTFRNFLGKHIHNSAKVWIAWSTNRGSSTDKGKTFLSPPHCPRKSRTPARLLVL